MTRGILSTKKLSGSQKELLLNAGFSLVEKNFITIEPVEFQLDRFLNNIIFTSKNAVDIVLGKYPKEKLGSARLFCVGDKTAELLATYGLEATEVANYGADLAEKIRSRYSNEEFLFFCGKKRRPELPGFLAKNNIKLTEVKVYDTIPTPTKMEHNFDGILFFSPSAVKSYCSVNDMGESTAFCIGRTTVSEAEKYTSNIEMARKPSIENVVVQVVRHFKNDQKQPD